MRAEFRRNLKMKSHKIAYRGTDFGLSKEGLSQGEFSKSFCGPIAYLAPEMLKRSGHSRSVD